MKLSNIYTLKRPWSLKFTSAIPPHISFYSVNSNNSNKDMLHSFNTTALFHSTTAARKADPKQCLGQSDKSA